MSNPYFNFKQFTVFQDKCAMKVCTDACVLGAWAAGKLYEHKNIKHILDIGTGTGLLSLMLAQQSTARIDAIEINVSAAAQAEENFYRSPWKEKITLHKCAVQEFRPAYKYDVIISNPPFYKNDLKSPDDKINSAKHDSTLTLDELIFFIQMNLNPNGRAIIMLPFFRMEYCEKLASRYSLFTRERLLIKQSPIHSFFRSVLILSASPLHTLNNTELTIHDKQRNYTPEFKTLLKDYNLHF